MRKTVTALLALITLITTNVSGVTVTRVGVHDPSVVYEPTSKYYYIFGSHRATARTKDMMKWENSSWSCSIYGQSGAFDSKYAYLAFSTCNTTKVTIGGVEKDFQNFDAKAWSSAYGGDYNIMGNLWAPDVIYNNKMQKWCMYMSVNGPTWNSSIVLLTSDKITGPYLYQGPVIITGFNVNNNAEVSYKKTDLELVIGTQSSLPSRYTSYWGSRWPHAIDPCVFYDEEGTLWMAYGSWSGGIWMLKLNEETGLRDYDTKYSVVGSGDAVTSDPYFGKRIADGFYSSGEGSYIEYIGGYYFLFISNGGLAAGGVADDFNNGGYQMRVFRSEKADGPYKDKYGRNAIYTSYQRNFGPGCYTAGVNIFGAYGSWGNMNDGERSQGHNSIIAAEDGRTYLVYHSRFQNMGEMFMTKVHQVFQNKDGWLVAAPFEYTGEKVKSDDIATTQQIATEQIPGKYKLLMHKYGIDHTKKELCTPVEVTLSSDGKISGAYSGLWGVTEGTSYMYMIVGGTRYEGVMVEQGMDKNTNAWSVTFTPDMVPAFTGLATGGVTVWAYRYGDDPTGISEVTIDKWERGTWYDMQGRMVTSPIKKGVYIKNGKKIIIK